MDNASSVAAFSTRFRNPWNNRRAKDKTFWCSASLAGAEPRAILDVRLIRRDVLVIEEPTHAPNQGGERGLSRRRRRRGASK